MRKFYKQFFSLVFSLSSFYFIHAQVGVYDAGFGTGGKVFQLFSDADITPQAIIAQPDGKIVVGGSGGDFFEGGFRIVRYHTNGAIDETFGNNGIVTFTRPTDQDILQSLAIQPDGKIIAGGVTQTTDPVTQETDADFYLFRLKADGSFDSTFGINGQVVTDLDQHSGDALHKVVLKPDGKILAGGYFMDMNTGDNFYGLVQYKNNGSRDSAFGTNGITVLPLPQKDDGKGSLALLPNGKILAATTVVNDTSFFYEFGLVRFNANGSVDAGFGNAGVVHLGLTYFHSVLHDMAVQADGKILLAGETQSDNTVIAVVRVDSTGAYDPGFGTNGVVRTHISTGSGPDAGNTLTIQPDNKIIVGCTLDNSINSYDANFAVVRYLPDGNVDLNFGRQGIIITDIDGNGDFTTASLQQTDGKFVLVGSAESQNSETGFGIVRYLSDARYYYNILKGSVFYDNNANGIKDPGEDFFGNATIIAEKPGIDSITIAASTGIFNADVDTGNYIIRPVQPYYTSVPAFKTTNHSSYFNTDSVSFAMQPVPGIRDIFVDIIPLNSARPGFETDYMIMYGNKGTDSVTSGSLEFIAGNLVTVTSSAPAASSVSNDTLRWNYVNLYPHDTSYIIVHATILAPPAVNNGDTLTSVASVSSGVSDQEPGDNIFILHEDVVGSYDPNDKNEIHAGQMSPAQVNAGEYLQYIIRFQNTGTDTAFNIYVRDTLQNTLDWSTMKMVAASHPYNLVIDKGICAWSFNNIGLVDSTRNKPGSHGFIIFRIKPKASLVAGNIINNTASIYFDYNLPVMTNTETTLIVSAPLPVKLLSFSAKAAGKTSLLQWATTNEINVGRFEVERSATGASFEKIGSITAISGAGEINTYEYTDALALATHNYYRLKIIDKDGKFDYSPVRMLSHKSKDYFTIYPNPVKDIMYLKMETEKKSSVQVQIVMPDGKLVLSAAWNSEEGTSVKELTVPGLKRGTYFLKIVSSDNSSVHKAAELIVMKFEKL